MKTRINKYLADRGVCSRRKADDLISSGKVVVNGTVAELGLKVDDSDDVVVNGSKLIVDKPKEVYLAYNKPVGIITSVDPNAHDNVIQQINYPERVFPIGRLDVASCGLLLLTNDGRLSERITHPRYDHDKEYVVTVDKLIADKDLETMRRGLVILGSMTKPAIVTRSSDDTFHITLTEGRNRQIRRMCEELGYDVRKLMRIRVMNIELGNLIVGQYRELTNTEVAQLKKSVNMDKPLEESEKRISFE
ncbi:MAG: pseudouridine synthase [Candidatus Uhrbacteria bacterium]|nr:pseudouridine synthase [Candidatus Uhrbacteria bacterium]